MKTCPFCAEQIQDAAIVCKHCKRDLPGQQSGWEAEARAALAHGSKIEAIKIVREHTGKGLAEAKALVETWPQSQEREPRSSGSVGIILAVVVLALVFAAWRLFGGR